MNANGFPLLLHNLKGKTLRVFPFVLLLILFFSCDVENYGSATITMNPPLALTATQVSNGILLEFWGLNNESFFQGYDIRFITNQGAEHSNLSGVAVPNPKNEVGKVALNGLYPDPNARFYTFTVEGFPQWITLTNEITNIETNASSEVLTNIFDEISNFVSNDAFVPGDYHFGVRAYTSLYPPYYSEFGNIVTLTFTN